MFSSDVEMVDAPPTATTSKTSTTAKQPRTRAPRARKDASDKTAAAAAAPVVPEAPKFVRIRDPNEILSMSTVPRKTKGKAKSFTTAPYSETTLYNPPRALYKANYPAPVGPDAETGNDEAETLAAAQSLIDHSTGNVAGTNFPLASVSEQDHQAFLAATILSGVWRDPRGAKLMPFSKIHSLHDWISEVLQGHHVDPYGNEIPPENEAARKSAVDAAVFWLAKLREDHIWMRKEYYGWDKKEDEEWKDAYMKDWDQGNGETIGVLEAAAAASEAIAGPSSIAGLSSDAVGGKRKRGRKD